MTENSLLNKLLLAFAVVFAMSLLQSFIVPLIFAVILSVAVFPLVRLCEVKLKFSTVFSAALGVLVLTLCMSVIMLLVYIEVGDVMSKWDIYSTRFTILFDSLEAYLVEKFGYKGQIYKPKALSLNEIEALVSQNVNTISDLLSFSTSIIIRIMFIPLYVFFILCYRKFLLSFLYKGLKSVSVKKLNRIIRKIFKVIQNYMKGLFSVMFIVGVLNSVGLLILGIDNAIFFGFLGGVLMLFPYIGITIGSLLPALVALATKDSPWYAVAVMALFFTVQILEGNFITPKLTGSKVSVNAFVAILSFVLFGMLWGIAGLMLALPITASLKVILDSHPDTEHWGYLIGEPESEHFARNSASFLKFSFFSRKQKQPINSGS